MHEINFRNRLTNEMRVLYVNQAQYEASKHEQLGPQWERMTDSVGDIERAVIRSVQKQQSALNKNERERRKQCTIVNTRNMYEEILRHKQILMS